MSDGTLFVFDTNTLISSLLFANYKPAQAFRKALVTGFLVCSDTTLAELSEVLMRSKSVPMHPI
jgi:predicted nucleic acid-binding protein